MHFWDFKTKTNGNDEMNRYGLIGEKLPHSFSPIIHEYLGNPEYDLFEIPKDDIDSFMKGASFEAANVTIPYKETVMKYCKFIDDTALSIGSVNTLVRHSDGLYGYNTDYLGFEFMVSAAGIDIKDEEVIVLGSGGTAKTAVYSAGRLKARRIIVVSRSGNSFETDTECPVEFIDYEKINEHKNAGILINTTPVGMFPNIYINPIDIDIFVRLNGVIDVIYNPLNTKLVLDARRRGIKATNGLEMLVAQGYYAERLFMGRAGLPSKEELDRLKGIVRKLSDLKRNIVLIGMPGCGKTTTGLELSGLTGKKLLDTDEEFTKDYGMTPAECISRYSEEEFRNKESETVRKTASLGGVIIATGGGAVLRKENVEALRMNGVIIFLDTPLEFLATEGRPLSQGDGKLKKLFEERYPIYLSAMDKKVKTDKDSTKTAKEILDFLREEI